MCQKGRTRFTFFTAEESLAQSFRSIGEAVEGAAASRRCLLYLIVQEHDHISGVSVAFVIYVCDISTSIILSILQKKRDLVRKSVEKTIKIFLFVQELHIEDTYLWRGSV